MFAEVKVSVQNQDKKKLTMEYTIEEEFMACQSDPTIRRLVDETVSQFQPDPMDELSINLKIHLEIQ